MAQTKYDFTYVRLGYTFQNSSEQGFVIQWGCNGLGFGELTFIKYRNKIKCETEYMSREFIDAVMDEFVKNLILEDK